MPSQASLVFNDYYSKLELSFYRGVYLRMTREKFENVSALVTKRVRDTRIQDATFLSQLLEFMSITWSRGYTAKALRSFDAVEGERHALALSALHQRRLRLGDSYMTKTLIYISTKLEMLPYDLALYILEFIGIERISVDSARHSRLNTELLIGRFRRDPLRKWYLIYRTLILSANDAMLLGEFALYQPGACALLLKQARTLISTFSLFSDERVIKFLENNKQSYSLRLSESHEDALTFADLGIIPHALCDKITTLKLKCLDSRPTRSLPNLKSLLSFRTVIDDDFVSALEILRPTQSLDLPICTLQSEEALESSFRYFPRSLRLRIKGDSNVLFRENDVIYYAELDAIKCIPHWSNLRSLTLRRCSDAGLQSLHLLYFLEKLSIAELVFSSPDDVISCGRELEQCRYLRSLRFEWFKAIGFASAQFPSLCVPLARALARIVGTYLSEAHLPAMIFQDCQDLVRELPNSRNLRMLSLDMNGAMNSFNYRSVTLLLYALPAGFSVLEIHNTNIPIEVSRLDAGFDIRCTRSLFNSCHPGYD